jgi:hypothetical protein
MDMDLEQLISISSGPVTGRLARFRTVHAAVPASLELKLWVHPSLLLEERLAAGTLVAVSPLATPEPLHTLHNALPPTSAPTLPPSHPCLQVALASDAEAFAAAPLHVSFGAVAGVEQTAVTVGHYCVLAELWPAPRVGAGTAAASASLQRALGCWSSDAMLLAYQLKATTNSAQAVFTSIALRPCTKGTTALPTTHSNVAAAGNATEGMSKAPRGRQSFTPAPKVLSPAMRGVGHAPVTPTAPAPGSRSCSISQPPQVPHTPMQNPVGLGRSREAPEIITQMLSGALDPKTRVPGQ